MEITSGSDRKKLMLLDRILEALADFPEGSGQNKLAADALLQQIFKTDFMKVQR